VTGAIFKSTIPDESDEERRELERYTFSHRLLSLSWFFCRMVADAAAGKSKHYQMQAEARAAAKNRKEAILHSPKNGEKTGGSSTDGQEYK
jgi:hypothetical protein